LSHENGGKINSNSIRHNSKILIGSLLLVAVGVVALAYLSRTQEFGVRSPQNSGQFSTPSNATNIPEKPLSSPRAPEAGSAVRLIVVVPSTITQGQVIPIGIKAVDESGKVDPQRNDVVKVSIGQGNGKVRDPTAANKSWAKEVAVELSKGIAKVEILDEIQEIAKLTAVWVSGQSYIQPASIGVICVGQH